MDDLLPLKEIKNYSLNKSEISIPSSLRFFKKLGFLILVLDKCSYSKKASTLKLQFFNWAFSSNENLAMFSKILKNENTIPDHAIHLDPSINKTIEFGVSDGFLKIDNNGKIEMTSKGKELSKKIINDREVLVRELSTLNEIRKKVSENKLGEIFRKLNEN